MNNITLKELKESLTTERIIQLVTELGSDEYVDRENYIIFKTICHNVDASDASLKLYYYKKDHRFVCYTECNSSFNIYELFKKRYELLGIKYNFYKDIVLKIAEGVQLQYKAKTSGFYEEYKSIYEKYEHNNPDINFNKIDKKILNIYTFFPTPEWLNDGISEEIMKEYNILYSIEENKIIIPHYDINDNLIGIRARALNEEDIAIGKYMPVQIGHTIYSHPLMYNLYGLNKVKNNIKEKKIAILAEGEKSPMQYGTMVGQENNICVASCGNKLHTYQIDLLISSGAERIIVAYDKTGASWKEQEQYYYHLKDICSKYKNKCEIGFLYDTDNLLDLKQSPFDKGLDTFKKLYTKGVWL